jgi:hypothetical protein
MTFMHRIGAFVRPLLLAFVWRILIVIGAALLMLALVIALVV